jgi:hypothetical protein
MADLYSSHTHQYLYSGLQGLPHNIDWLKGPRVQMSQI